ncbi:MAG: FAD-dependent oxidoreductase [Burkholderiales bacterium]|nr:FAD-dependent oxidoreductase [Burkholderiales bacterium]
MKETTVVGAGIVGIVTAIYLQREGHRVTVVDRQAPGEGTSFGNAGSVAPASIIPVAMPGTLKQVPKWLSDPLGPLSLSWRQLPFMLPWFLHFQRACDVDRVRRGAAILRSLNAPAVEAYADLLGAAGAPELLRREGMLHVYKTEAGFKASAFGRKLRTDNGCVVELVDADRIRELAPGLSSGYRWGFNLPDNAHVHSPLRVVQVLAELFKRNGGTIIRANVTDIECDTGGCVKLHTDGMSLSAECVVIAAGYASGKLAAKLGTRVPLAPERGYHIEIPGAVPAQHCPVTDGESRFVATPMAGGLRIAGTSEFQAADAAPNWARAETLATLAEKMFPGLQSVNYSRWMGVRPSTPDSTPVIGRSSRHPQVVFAFGHGHWGLMAAPVTGQLVTDLVAERAPRIDVSPFRPERFSFY